MISEADLSTMPVWPWQFWACIIAALLTIAAIAAHSRAQRSHERRSEYEASPYGPVRDRTHHLCELHGHNYYLNDVGTYWVCTRGDDKVARIIPMDDLATIESYANGEIA